MKLTEEEKKTSEIGGTGYGSDHNWERGLTNQVGADFWSKGTHFRCRNCGVSFTHSYDLIPDIFEAIKRAGVPEKCQS